MTVAIPTPCIPAEILNLARERWLETARLDLGEIARDLGIGRATIFRKVGSRDELMGEVIWSFHEPELQRALAESGQRGALLMADICRESMQSVRRYEPMRRWTSRDSEYALRILSHENGVINQRAVQFAMQVLSREIDASEIKPVIPVEELARLLVRIETSFLFSDLACGREPSIESACKAVEILVAART